MLRISWNGEHGETQTVFRSACRKCVLVLLTEVPFILKNEHIRLILEFADSLAWSGFKTWYFYVLFPMVIYTKIFYICICGFGFLGGLLRLP